MPMNYSQFKQYAKRGYTGYPDAKTANGNDLDLPIHIKGENNVIESKEQQETCNKFQFMSEE